MACVGCGESVLAGARFCSVCGRSVMQASVPPPPPAARAFPRPLGLDGLYDIRSMDARDVPNRSPKAIIRVAMMKLRRRSNSV